jgi:hypothetical protein
VALLILVGPIVAACCWNRRGLVRPTEVYQGVTYSCQQLESDVEGGGLMHWVCVDLGASGIELYVTPLDPAAIARGWQFRLKRTGAVVEEERLAVGMNGTFFTSNSGWLRMAGDLAVGEETTVASHHVSHAGDNTYLLWFEDDLTPHLETSKPPGQEVLSRACWGIGAQSAWLDGGKISEAADRAPTDARTAIGIDGKRKLLFLAVFQQAKAVRPGPLIGGWRPVATHFGVRANALKD